jgi:predicted nucleotidyltransferase
LGTPVASEQTPVANCSALYDADPSSCGPPSYRKALQLLMDDGAAFMVGGALAVAAYCGIRRSMKDLDLFAVRKDVPRVLDVLARGGFAVETPYPHWLAKAHTDDGHIDVIFNSGNGAAPVDGEWLEQATSALVLGTVVRMCPVEETIWSKASVMERERFDGADIAHLILAQSATLDWGRLLRRFGEHWRVLFAHLLLFGYIFPDEASCIPRWLMDELTTRLRDEISKAPRRSRVCCGTLLSREQYLPDIARGWRDARLPPTGTMSVEAIALWTDAIAHK